MTQQRYADLPPLSLCCRVTSKYDRVTTLYTPSVTVARNSSAHASIHLRIPIVPNLEEEILNILKLPYNIQCNGHFVTVSQNGIQTSDGS